MKGKQLVIAMIIVASIGTVLMMMGMFMGMRELLDRQKPLQEQKPEVEKEEIVVPDINSVILGVVEVIAPDKIKIQDIEKKQEVEAVITVSTQIMDAYTNAMPLDMIQVGDLVQLTYNANKAELISINTYKEGWEKTDIKQYELDRSNRTITIGSTKYNYTNQTLMMDIAGNPVNSYQIGDYDTLILKGINETVYSVQVTEKEAYLQLENTPTNEGFIEINTNRQIPIGMISSKIPLHAGVHKIVMNLEGYEVMVEELTFEAGQTVTFNLGGAQRLSTELSVEVLNEGVTDYTLFIDGVMYPTGTPITLFGGDYKIEVRAQGYKNWVKQIHLTQGSVLLPVHLEAVPQEDDAVEEDTSANTDGLYTIKITTDPSDAAVFIEDERKGQTPMQLELPVGTYRLRLQAEGYESYETTILVEASDTKNNYYYMLIEE